MSFVSKVGVINCPAATGDLDVDTGLGIQIKAVLFWVTRETSAPAKHSSATSLTTGGLTILGMADGTSQVCLHNSDDFTGGDLMYDDTCCILCAAHEFGAG